MKLFKMTALIALVALSARGETLEDARLAVTRGDYDKGRKIAEKLAAADSKLSATPLYNYIIGVCDFEDGNYSKALKHLETSKSKGYGASNLYLGRLAFLDYDFDNARELYSDYRKYRDKLGQEGGETVEELENQLTAAENALERVERIAVIDSIAVPAEDFFKAYRLPASAGRLLSPNEMPQKDHREGAVMAFSNEGGDFMMWGEPDSVGNVRLVESLRLTDGTWQDPVATPEFLNDNGYADYPFMMPDGVTLYYASDGDGSIGGYDIFVVTRDAQTGEYLQPQNLGMPFNSPYDDFMLAIDEENGVGWWATDRNGLGDKLTIYVYQVNDLRKNYSPDDEDIIDKARLSDYRSTQNKEDQEVYSELRDRISSIDPDKKEKRAEFHLPKGNGEYYTSSEEFRSPEARAALKKYLMASLALEKSEADLSALRQRYARTHADAVREMIKTAESAIEKERREVRALRSDIYRHERNGK